MSQTISMTIRLPINFKDRLDALARKTARSKSDIAASALEEYLDVNDWQVKAIQEALDEANSPNALFFDHDEVVNRMQDRLNR